ncbi:Uncharacterised protein [Mycobacteroides abscessus subsp. abscessus]|nr:Uncharacterised protein [Mycobacteroides abscessus subsp. abscessus]
MVRSGPTSLGTYVGSGSTRSLSTNTTMSPVVVASDRHSTSPLPSTTGMPSSADSRVSTLAPAARATSMVASVDPESTTTSSSTNVPTSGSMASTTLPTVRSSLSAGSTTEIVRPAFASTSSSTEKSGRSHVLDSSQVAAPSDVEIVIDGWESEPDAPLTDRCPLIASAPP